MQRLLAWISMVLLAAATTACAGRPPPAQPQRNEVRVLDSAGAPVEGATLLAGPTPLGRTGSDGIARIELTGRDGDLFAITVRCPEDYASPHEALVVRGLAVGAGVASHVVRCKKLRHHLVVAVRADGGPHLPVLRLGRVVGTTDAAGAATLLFDLGIDERLELQLSTADLAKENVSPRDPVAFFEVPDSDALKVFDIKLSRPRPPARRRPPPRRGPVAM